MPDTLSPELLRKIDAYWRAANYLSIGQIYLYDNPLLREPLKQEHIKPRLLGHWGTTPGLNLIYVHLNRVIREHGLNVIYITGPGHGGPALVANTYLEGTYSEVYTDITPDEAEIIRVYLPPDANTLLSVTDHCLRSRDYVNVIVAGKQPAPQWLDMDAAIKHCATGASIWEWASNDQGGEPDVVLACCGDVPTLETLAAIDLIRRHLPELKVRVVNVVNLMKLQPRSEHPHGLSDWDFNSLFTLDKPIIFAFHGYPWLIHRLTYRRANHKNLHVRGYKEEGTTTTPFDMVALNDLDRFHLVIDVINRVPKLGARAAHLKQRLQNKLLDNKEYAHRHGEDMPDVRDWKWGY